MRTVCDKKKTYFISNFLQIYFPIFKPQVLLSLCLHFKEKARVYLQEYHKEIYVLRHIFSVTLSFSYDSVKPKKNNNKHGLEKQRVLETGNFRFFDFLGFLLFFIKCLNALVKVTKCANQILM